MKKSRILIYQNEFSSYGGYKTVNYIDLYLKEKLSLIKISNSDVKNKLHYKLIKILNNILSNFFGHKITTLITPQLKKSKIKFDKILIGYANEIYDFKNLLYSKIKKFYIINDDWIFTGFSHFNLNQGRFKNILINFIQYYSFNYIQKKINNSKNFYFIFSCDYFKKIALRKFNLPHKNYITIKNPVNTQFWRKKNSKTVNIFKKKLLLNKNHFYILIYLRGGFENYRKGGDRFKKLISVFDEYKDIKFLIVGSDRRVKIKNSIFIKTRDLSFLREIIHVSSISINLSRKEGVPYSILESMSCGTPVLSMNSGGINEIIDNNINGFLFSKFDLKKIKQKIIFLKKNKKTLNKFGNKASKIVFLKHGHKKILNNYYKLLKN